MIFLSYRLPKVNELIKKQLAQIIFEEQDFGPGVFVTLMEVKSSANLQEATVKMSVLPEKERKRVLAKLNKNIYALQKILDKKLFMRPVPKIQFVVDESQEKAAQIDQLLEKIKNERRT